MIGKNLKRLLTARQAKVLDLKLKEKFGISILVLMENAGRAVAEEVNKTSKGKGRIAIFCGKGNNGGDGFVAARHLLMRGIKPDIFLAGKITDVQNEAKVNLDILIKMKQRIIEANGKNLYPVKSKISKYDLIVDALFGVGLAGEVRGIFKDLISAINSSGAYILSVDIPSGLDATKGKILGCCVKANKTVTFIARKRGMVLRDGPKVCGTVIVRDLGISLFLRSK